MSVKVQVYTLGGNSCVVNAEPNWNGRSLKEAIAKIIGVLPREQRLINGVTELSDDGLLTNLITTDVAHFTLLRRAPDMAEWIEELTSSYRPAEVFRNSPMHLKHDLDFLCTAMKMDGVCLQFTPDEFRNNPEVVLAAVIQNANTLQYASPDLLTSRDFLTVALKQNGFALKHVGASFRADPELVLIAVSGSGHALEFASPSLQRKREIVLAAVVNSGTALMHASEELKDNRQIVLAAASQRLAALSFASNRWQKDKRLLQEAIAALP